MNFKLALSLLATAPMVHATAETNLRGNEERRLINQYKDVGGYDEKLKKCTGALCAVYGDPHLITCDGRPYDCQAHGIFNIMQNGMYSIQGHFKDIPKPGHLKFSPGASWMSDIAVKFTMNPDVPVVQIGYGDIGGGYEGIPSEIGCERTMMYRPHRIHGQGNYGDHLLNRTTDVESVYDCRELCDAKDGCAKFNFFANGKCDMIDDLEVPLEKQPGSWNLVLAGTMESDCGKKHDPLQYRDGQEQFFHGAIGGNKKQYCPLLLHLDGELQDISKFAHAQTGYLVGDKNSDFHIEMFYSDIYIRNKLPSGEYTEIKATSQGRGPSEQWGCSWKMFMCLPEAGADLYVGSLGLMGTIDNDMSNDWMDKGGNTITVQHERENYNSDSAYFEDFYPEAYYYCRDNWCVSQEDSIMTYPGLWTYEDMKCGDEPFIDFEINNPACVLSADELEERCAGTEPLLMHGCLLDCCYGGCEDAEETMEELDPLGSDDDSEPEPPPHEQCTDEGGLLNTGDTVCPGSSIIEVLSTSGEYDGELPDISEIIYGIIPDVEYHDQVTVPGVKFRVNNPFGSTADVYVKHETNTVGSFLDLHCDADPAVEPGCDTTAGKIEAACTEYPGSTPFAFVSVYFASDGFTVSDNTVDKCCQADVGGKGIIEYKLKIDCMCPDDIAEL